MAVLPRQAASCRWPWAVAACLVLAGPPAGAQVPAARSPAGETLIERTLAVVGGAVVTESDVDVAVNLGLVEPAADGARGNAASAVVDRWLMLHEVARFSPAEPDAAAVQMRLALVRAQAGGEERLTATVTRAGFSTAWLTGWVRDDLRLAAYLDRRFASAGVPGEAEVTAYVDAHRAGLERAGVPAAEIAQVARERLVAKRRRDLIADWLADLRRRTDVVEFRRGPPG